MDWVHVRTPHDRCQHGTTGPCRSVVDRVPGAQGETKHIRRQRSTATRRPHRSHRSTLHLARAAKAYCRPVRGAYNWENSAHVDRPTTNGPKTGLAGTRVGATTKQTIAIVVRVLGRSVDPTNPITLDALATSTPDGCYGARTTRFGPKSPGWNIMNPLV